MALVDQHFQTLSRWVVVVVLWLIIGSIAIGKAGIANFMELMHERDILVDNNLHLAIRNQMLEKQIDTLSHSSAQQERFIKQNFGYTSPEEFVFFTH